MKKQQKYQDLNAGVDSVPFAIETSGVWGEQAMELVAEIGRRIAEVNRDPRSTSFLTSCVSESPWQFKKEMLPASMGHCRPTDCSN